MRSVLMAYGEPPQIVSISQPATTVRTAFTESQGWSRSVLVAAPSHVMDRTTPLMLTASRLPASIVQPDGSKSARHDVFPGVNRATSARTLWCRRPGSRPD
jgi:hypothetical protein